MQLSNCVTTTDCKATHALHMNLSHLKKMQSNHAIVHSDIILFAPGSPIIKSSKVLLTKSIVSLGLNHEMPMLAFC